MLTKLFTADPVAILEGTTTAVTGTFAEVPQTSMLTLDWRRSAFAALREQLHRYAVPDTQSLFVEVQPGGAAHGSFSAAPDLVLSSPPSGEDDLSFGPVSFGNPFPPEWPIIYGAMHTFSVPYSLPGARQAVRLRASVMSQALGADGGQPIVPRVGPVRALTVAGADAWGNLSGVGVTPLLAWSPPEFGEPTEYLIEIIHLTKAAMTPTTEAETIALLRTTMPRIRVPPGLLEPGEAYVFSVLAWWGEGEDVERAPFRTGLAAAGATVLTAIVRP